MNTNIFNYSQTLMAGGLHRAAGILFVCAGSAGADVLTLDAVYFSSQVGSFQNYPTLEFAKFNSSLGTLTSITFDWVVNSSVVSATVTNLSAGSVTIDRFDFTRNFNVTGPNDTELLYSLAGKNTSFQAVSLANGQSKTVANTTFGQLSETVDIYSGLDAYTGSSGNVSLALSNSIGVTPRVTAGGAQQLVWNTSVTGLAEGYLTVSYTYDAAPFVEEPPVTSVPEPSSILLCGAPALLGGFAFVRRKRNDRRKLVQVTDKA